MHPLRPQRIAAETNVHHSIPTPSDTTTVAPERTLADLAASHAGASRVFQRHGLDFCCRGQQTLAAACATHGLDPLAIADELRAATIPVPDHDRWQARSTPDLLAHILERYHQGHRAELPRLLAMAAKVEAVHRDHGDCPVGLHTHLQHVATELEQHMQKEEQVLFPMLLRGTDPMLRGPIFAMESEHLEHGRNLERLRSLARDFTPPPDACATWRALYLGLAALEREVMEHIHLENHELFPRVTAPR
jgi:regulator of cell morphogenesis and NO signaling